MKQRVVLYGFALLFLLLFPYGPLLPWSPVKPGFERLALERADVYFPAGSTLDPAYRKLDEYIVQSEKFHRLSAPRRICVIACPDWEHFQRYLPQFRTKGIGAVTLDTGTVIYLSPKMVERKLDVNEFLRHEISHATLHQNQSLWNSFQIGKVEWLSEGLAVAFGDQKAYYSDAEFLARFRREDVAPSIDPARRAEVKEKFELRYAYVSWRKFNEFLMADRGRDAYQHYLEAVMRDPGSWRELFPKHLGLTFDEAMAAFQASTLRAADAGR